MHVREIQMTDYLPTPHEIVLVHNVNPSQGFLCMHSMSAGRDIVDWAIWSPHESTNMLEKKANGTLRRTHTTMYPFPTTDGGYAVAYTERLGESSNAEDVKLYWKAYVRFLPPGSQDWGPQYIIYDTSPETAQFFVYTCDFAYSDAGYNCFIILGQKDDEFSRTCVRVGFLTSGSVITQQIVANSRMEMSGVNLLVYGGYLITFYKNRWDHEEGIIGHVYNSHDEFQRIWDVPEVVRVPATYDVLSNNTMFTVLKATNDNWTFFTTDLPRFTNDTGYGTPRLRFGVPPKNAKVKTPPTVLELGFVTAVSLSVGNVTVYRMKGRDELMRQTVSGLEREFCRTSGDNRTVYVKVLDSTFNEPGAEYYVMMETNFVRDARLNEPLLGTRRGEWTIGLAGSAGVREKSSGDVTATLRLTTNGTLWFKTLNETAYEQFFNQLRDELADVLPIERDRLTTSQISQLDSSTPTPKLMLLQFKAKNMDSAKKDARTIVHELDIMIRHKSITPVSRQYLTSLLDESYGFRPTPNLWEMLKFKALYPLGGFLLLCIAYALARRRYKKGRNLAIFQVIIIIIDLVLDITFIVKNGRDVQALYYPSIMILLLSIAFNGILAFLTIIRENTRNPAFYEWFKNNTFSASVFTLTASAEIEAMQFLSSRFAGLQMVSAPFSDKAQQWLFWGGFVTLIVEDIPQFIIQVLYFHFAIVYSIIPFFTLITSSIVMVTNLIGKLRHVVCHCLHRHKRYSPSTVSPMPDIVHHHDDNNEHGTNGTSSNDDYGTILHDDDETSLRDGYMHLHGGSDVLRGASYMHSPR